MCHQIQSKLILQSKSSRMLWRQVFEQYLQSSQFANKQLPFEEQIYKRVLQCYKNEAIKSQLKQVCGKSWEDKLQQYAIAVQWVIRERQKSLQREIRKQCKGQDLIECIDKKSRGYIQKYFEKDKTYLQLLRGQVVAQ